MNGNVKLIPEISNDFHFPRVANVLMLVVWIAAAIGIVLPFALGTSPLDAVLLRVPHNEGNWWHVLVGLPFFLSLPMIWLHWRLLTSVRQPAIFFGRALWIMIIFSALGTLLVETPFLLHRAGTSEFQRLAVIFSGIGIILFSGTFLYLKRKKSGVTQALLIGIAAAYLANAFLCLIVYGEAKFEAHSRSGWHLTAIIVLPILAQLIWLLFKSPDGKNNWLRSISNG